MKDLPYLFLHAVYQLPWCDGPSFDEEGAEPPLTELYRLGAALQVTHGDPTLTKISSAAGPASRDGTVRPNEPQRIEKASVLKPVQ